METQFFSSEDGRFTRFGKPPKTNMARLDVVLIGDMRLSIVVFSIVILVFPGYLFTMDTGYSRDDGLEKADVFF